MTAIDIGDDLAQLDAAIAALPNNPAVFALWPKEGEPYLSKTALLRRRLLRLLKERETAVASAQSAPHRESHRISVDWVTFRIERGPL